MPGSRRARAPEKSRHTLPMCAGSARRSLGHRHLSARPSPIMCQCVDCSGRLGLGQGTSLPACIGSEHRIPASRLAPALPGKPPRLPAYTPGVSRDSPAPPGVSAGGEIPCRLAAGAKGARRTAVCRERPAPPGVPNFSLNFSLNFGLNFNLKFSLNFSLNFSGISRLV